MSLTAKIEEIFNNPEKASEESVNALVQEAIRVLGDLKERLGSDDEKVRNGALEDAAKMQLELKEQIEKMQEPLGIDPGQIEGYSKAADAALARENAFGQALQKLQQSLADQTKHKKPKRVKEWLAS